MHTLAPPNRQLSLLTVAPSYRITKNAQARNAYGTVAAELVCAALRLETIPINGNYSICFDAARDGRFYEIKSVRRSGKVVIYDWRMDKEANVKVPLYYAILIHNVRKSDGRRLVEEMTSSALELLVIEASRVHAIARAQPLQRFLQLALDPRNGYTRRGYKDGYRNVPVRLLRDLAPHHTRLACLYADHAFDVDVKSCHQAHP